MAYYSFLDRKTIKTWLHDAKRKKGATRLNVEFLREIRECRDELAKVAIIGYFLTVTCGINDCRQIFQSATKQRRLMYAVEQALKTFMVTSDYEKAFQADIAGFHRRAEHAMRILKENVRLTEHAPFFEACGYQALDEYSGQWMRKEDREAYAIDKIKPKMDEWNAQHQQEIAEHMKSVRREIEIRDRHRAEVKERIRAEKQEEKEKRKAENAEIREMRKNAKAHAERVKKIEREFERYYGRQNK